MSRIISDRRVLLSTAVIGVLLAVALWPDTVLVDLATVSRGPLAITVDEEGKTRVRQRFIIAAPVTGRILRIELEPGDRVRRGAVIARMQPERPTLLDTRARAEAVAAVASAEATLGRARAEEQRARAALKHAQAELARSRQLTAAGAAAAQDLDARVADAALATEAANVAAFAVRVASAEVERTRARIAQAARSTDDGIVSVTAPIDAVVLQRVRQSETVVPAGEPLVEIGDPSQIEIVSDLLSTDAVRVRPGARALIEQWGGDSALAAIVRRIEPGGFTKVSALGVEEQRVNVVLDLVDESEDCALLGDAYRVEVRIVLWERPAVLKVPTNALFRLNSQWAVYVMDAGRARLAIVEIGHQNAQESEVASGLSEGAIVIVHPGDSVRDGARVKRRPDPR